jgi:hypothetical protein
MVLKGVHYYHRKGSELDSRKVILSCSSQNGRFVSNSLEVEVRTGLLRNEQLLFKK